MNDRASELAHVIDLLDVRAPADEFRRLVLARMETLARLGENTPDHEARLECLRDALHVGLEAIREASR